MNILFVCTANRDRSRTAEIHFAEKHPEHNFKSAGINKYLCSRHINGQHLTRALLLWADRVVCMEHHHHWYIIERYGGGFNSITESLYLGDTESFMSEQLIKMLEEKFKI